MYISGITTCVGPTYAAHLARTLPVWLGTLDSLTVVTKPGDPAISKLNRNWLIPAVREPAAFAIIETDAFTKHGAHFNKGAALNVALDQARPTDWMLSLDCDVLPPADWRDHLAGIDPGYLYGCHRSDKRSGAPYGYFQLWHASDAQARPFAECYDHAGRYDAVFLEGWPKERRKLLPFTVEHLGEPATHWHGPGNEHLTRELLGQGVASYLARDEKLTQARHSGALSGGDE